MGTRYFICGSIQDGDRIIPEVVPELPLRTREFRGRTVTGTPDWAASYEHPTDARCVVWADLTEAEFAELAYDKTRNPDGYDWFEVADDGAKANEKGLLRAAERSGNSRVAAMVWLRTFTNAPDAKWPGRGE